MSVFSHGFGWYLVWYRYSDLLQLTTLSHQMVQPGDKVHKVVVSADLVLLQPVRQPVQVGEVPVQVHAVGVRAPRHVPAVLLWTACGAVWNAWSDVDR